MITDGIRIDFLEACSLGCLQRAELLLIDHPILVDLALDEDGNTGLMMATRYEQEDIARLLVQYGTDVSVVDNWGYSALFIAARYGRTNIIRLLLESGADVNLKNNSGSTALVLASQYGKTCAAEILIAYGANIDSKDNRDFTALRFTGFHSNTSQSQKQTMRNMLKALT